MEENKERVYKHGEMEQNMMEIGWMECSMELVLKHLLMDKLKKENMQMEIE